MDPMGKGFNQQNGDLITPWLILHTPPKIERENTFVGYSWASRKLTPS
jgi:hypothetical protein